MNLSRRHYLWGIGSTYRYSECDFSYQQLPLPPESPPMSRAAPATGNKLPFEALCLVAQLSPRAELQIMRLVSRGWKLAFETSTARLHLALHHLCTSSSLDLPQRFSSLKELCLRVEGWPDKRFRVHFRRRLSEWRVAHVSLANAGCDVTDVLLRALPKLKLTSLNLDSCRNVTDAGLAHLASLPLTDLDLGFCRNGD